MKFVLVYPGIFLAGSPAEEPCRRDDEVQHKVEISRPFYLSIYAVTQIEYQTVIGINPSFFQRTPQSAEPINALDTARFPVEMVSWLDAVQFCERLSQLPDELKARRVYRLPTEAEWEFSCRESGHSYGPFHFGSSVATEQANLKGSSPCGNASMGPPAGRTMAVGSFSPNTLGLYDMHGNVWEWCHDWYGAYDAGNRKRDPAGPPVGSYRVFRGGSWSNAASKSRSAVRSGHSPERAFNDVGFRVAAVALNAQ